MLERRYRLLLTFTHVGQYTPPVLRKMVSHPKLDIMAAYCSLQGSEPGIDPEFGVEVAWDVPLLDGYPWTQVPNRSPRPRLDGFFGLINPGLWTLVRKGNYDAVVAYTGYAKASFWILSAAAKIYRIPFIFGTDATSLDPRDGKRWKVAVKKLLLPAVFRLADAVIIPSEASRQFILRLGIPESRVFLTPYTVDNEWWSNRAAQADRAQTRRSWNIPVDAPVALFCAKLQPWKRPSDAIQAFVRADVPGSYLLMAGDGPLRAQLESEALVLGVSERVRFLGFLNQSKLPETYRSSDLFVLPSQHEPFGVVVNEAMLCGCPVAVSDHVGAHGDLVLPGKTGFVFPTGNIEALASIMRSALFDSEKACLVGQAGRERMKSWSARENIEALVSAVEHAIHLRKITRRGVNLKDLNHSAINRK